VLVLAAAGVGAGLGLRLSGGPPGPLPASLGVTENRIVPASVLDIPLVDQGGQTMPLSAFRGKVVVLASFLTSCQETCPITTGAYLEMQRALDAAGVSNKVVLIEASVDPGRDVPERLAAYSGMAGTSWPLLTASAGELEQLWKFFGIYFQPVSEGNPPGIDWQTGQPYTYDVNHSDGFILLDRNLHERFVTGAAPNTGGKLPANLKRLLSDEGRHDLADPGQGAWNVADGLQGVGWLLGRTIPSAPSAG